MENQDDKHLEQLIEHCEFWSESKESTREETYDEMVKHRAQLRKNNYHLKQDLQKQKEVILHKCLAIYFEELKELSSENQLLRKQYKQIQQSNKPKHSFEAPSRPTLCTPRMKKSLVLNENQNEKIQQGRRSLFNQPHGKNIQGRISLQSPRPLKKKSESRMTQRKKFMNNDHSERSSIKSRPSLNNPKSANLKQKNVFLSFINLILQQQKQKQQEYLDLASSEHQFHRKKENRIPIDDLQNEVLITANNIEKMNQVLNFYENQINDMKIDISSVNKLTKQMFEMKKNFMEMKSKCEQIEILRKQLKRKEFRIEELHSMRVSKIQPPESMKLMLRLHGIQECRISDSLLCKTQFQKIVKGKLQKPHKKRVKVKQLLDIVRQGRKKFKQLLNIYNGRISKLENKIQVQNQKINRRKKLKR